MPGKINLVRLAKSSMRQIDESLETYDEIRQISDHHPKRWASQFAAVELHAIWERYAEKRLIAALNHYAAHFLEQIDAHGVRRVPSGLASYIVRGGKRFFDFRDSHDLIRIGDRLLSPINNPFRELTDSRKQYINCLGAIRNHIVHGSDAADRTYRESLRGKPYHMKFVPTPGEFLNALDNRRESAARGAPRVIGIGLVLRDAIELTCWW